MLHAQVRVESFLGHVMVSDIQGSPLTVGSELWGSPDWGLRGAMSGDNEC